MGTFAFAGVVALLVAGHASSADPLSDRDRLGKFAKDYVAAVQSNVPAKVLALLHPALRRCMAGENRAFFDYIVSNQMKGFPSGKYTKVTITPVATKSQPMIWAFVPAKSFPFPVRPTYDVQIDYNTDPNGLFTDLLETAPSGGSWYWVTACPTKAGIQFMRAAQEKGDRQKAQARKLAAALHDPLLSQIKSLLARHDRIGAIAAYRKATGADLTTAVDVIDAVEGGGN